MTINVKSGAGVLALAMILASAPEGKAEFKVMSPIVEKGEVALEVVGSLEHDSNPDKSGGASHVAELEYGVTDYWMTEFEGEFGRDPGPDARTRFEAATWGNKIQLFPQGAHWMDAALWAEYSRAIPSGDADTVKFGPLLQKSIGPTTETANLFVEKEVGAHATGGAPASYAVQVRYDWLRELSPAVEAYGDIGTIGGAEPDAVRQQRLGPVLTGELSFGRAGELRYEVGYLAGLNADTPAHTFKWLAEYEMVF